MLRSDQQRTLDVLRASVGAGNRRICLQCPTAWGKTVLASEMVTNAQVKGKKVAFCVPAISLIDQTVDMFARNGILDVGVMQAKHHLTNWDMPIQVCSVQTLNRLKILPTIDLVLIDECHIWFNFYERWLGTPKDRNKAWLDVPVIGLSATPWRKGHGAWFDDYHKAATIREMIAAGILSPFRVYAPDHPDLTGVRIVGGDYDEVMLSDRMQERKLVANAVETWLKFWGKDKTLCYAVDRAHAMKLKLQFEAAGVPCGYQDHKTTDSERARLKRDFHSGNVRVVCNVETLTTGIDWDVRCISMNRPTRSDMLFVQIIGRGLRIAPEDAEPKDDLLILDHSDNHTRLGFVTDVDESFTGLHDGVSPRHANRTNDIRLPKECPQCGRLKLPKTALCPGCNFVAKVVSKIEPEPGELRELRPKPKAVYEPATMAEKAYFFAELKGYAFQQGYKNGWAFYKYKERFGVEPASEISKVPLVAPTMGTLSWIKSRQIAWAKSKRRISDGPDNN